MPVGLGAVSMPSRDRVAERMPSAPTTRSYRPDVPSVNPTATPEGWLDQLAIVTPSRTRTPAA